LVNNNQRDHFGVDGQGPIDNEQDFEKLFRVEHAVFQRVYLVVKDTPFFVRRINATGHPQAHPL